MNIRHFVTGLLAWGCAALHAQQVCTVSGAPLFFGSYNPLLLIQHDAQSSIEVRCSGRGAAVIRMQLGPGLAGTAGTRAMQQGASRLSYGLYQNAARTLAWGQGIDGAQTKLVVVTPNSSQTVQVYGRIPPRQNVPVGIYTDTVTVLMEW